MTEQSVEIRRTALERITDMDARGILEMTLKKSCVYDILEISRQTDMDKFYETVKYLPDNPKISYVVAILEVAD